VMQSTPELTRGGPNFTRLMLRRFTILAVPAGTGNPVGSAVAVLLDNQRRKALLAEARAWTVQAIGVVRTSPDADPSWTDEHIAGIILEKCKALDNQRKRVNREQPN
jgi:hypothetical protein